MKKLTLILVLFITGTFMGIHAQSLKSVEKEYNKAFDLLEEGDTLKAIESYQKCADMSTDLGELGECIKLTAEKKILRLYINDGQNEFNKKRYDAAIEAYEKASKYAGLINDPAITSDFKQKLAASYVGKGNELFRRYKYKDAIEAFLAAIEIDPEHAEAYYSLVLTYSKTEDGVKMEDAERKVQQYSNDNKLKAEAKIAAAAYYKKKCKEADKDKKVNIVSMMASKSLAYYQDPEVYYYYARACNEKQDWANAEKTALKSIRLSEDEIPDYYYELGRAYEGSGKNEKACEAFSKVSGGSNQQSAISRISVLDCK